LTGSNVYAVNADATGLTLLSDVPGTTGDIFWSPDGSKAGLHSRNADGRVDVYVVNADVSTRRPPDYTKTRRAYEYASSRQKLP
jgi:Tol biopolymer transport system component